MGSIHHHVILVVLDRLALALDADERLDEAIHLLLRLALGRLYHERIVHGEGERRRVESVVHQTTGNVGHLHAVVLAEVLQVEDHLMTHTTVLAGIIGAEFAFERLGHVVGVHDRHLGDTTQSVGAEHLDITVGDGQQQGVAVGRREHGRDPLLAAGGNHRVRRQELDQATQIGPTPGPPPP